MQFRFVLWRVYRKAMLKCFRCGQKITSKKYYRFIGDKDVNNFCVGCRNDEIQEMIEIDIEVAPLWAKNFQEVTNNA